MERICQIQGDKARSLVAQYYVCVKQLTEIISKPCTSFWWFKHNKYRILFVSAAQEGINQVKTKLIFADKGFNQFKLFAHNGTFLMT